MPQGHDPYAILIAPVDTPEKGWRALVEAVAVQACLDARGHNLTDMLEAIRWLRDPEVGGGKWWIEQVLQMDYEALLEQLHVRREPK